jgi:hypothetical protein
MGTPAEPRDVVQDRGERGRTRSVAGRVTTELIIDGTGVGSPVIGLLREQGIHPAVALFTGSERPTALGNPEISV